MPNKGKDRLYLALSHRHELPGYHWAILLAPKDSSTYDDSPDAARWDVTNESKDGRWIYRNDPINQYLSISLFARILLNKFEAKRRNALVEKIGKLFEDSVEVRQDDSTFNCHSWTLSALSVLERAGFLRLRVPLAELEDIASEFGDECIRKMQVGLVDIAAEGASAIPVLDLRRQ